MILRIVYKNVQALTMIILLNDSCSGLDLIFIFFEKEIIL